MRNTLSRVLTIVAAYIIFSSFFLVQDSNQGSNNKIIIIYSPKIEFSNQKKQSITYLIGSAQDKVVLKINNILIHCEYATINRTINQLNASQNVSIIEQNSFTITGDELIYNETSGIIEIKDNVNLNIKGVNTISSDSLSFNLKNREFYYLEDGQEVIIDLSIK